MDRKHMDVFIVHDEDGKSFWTKVGVAFQNRDGSYGITLAAMPTHGRLIMREPAPRNTTNKEG